MKSADLSNFINEIYAGRKLVIISNREPYIHKKTVLGIKTERPAGGLTSAMDNVLKTVGGIWIAWGSGSADRESVDRGNCVRVPPENPSYTIKRVWLTKNLVDNYYHGYSNQVLWPLCHTALNRVYFRRRFWEGYVKANFHFADAALEEISDDSIVWVHDYHLCLVPKLLKEKKPDITVAHFWHIPWPDWSAFRACPRSLHILEGLLGNDIIGFQLPLFVDNFMDCVNRCLDADIDADKRTVTYRGHTTILKAFPISVDFENFNSMSLAGKTVRKIKKLRNIYDLPELVGIGVDRLEYTKGLIKRLQALNLFFEKYEKHRGNFTFIQIAVPTRMKEPYISYRKTVEEMIHRINNRYSTDRWRPVIYIDKKIDHKDLVAYYRMADISIISSIYDGMNLVAKEFVASQVDEKGILILSELAGAADELEGAILVNPYDTENFCDSINISLKMPAEEKINRMKTLRRQVRDNDIHKWIADILYDIAAISSIKQNHCQYFFDSIDTLEDQIKNREIFLFFDYDGTLVPIVESPELAYIPEKIRQLIRKLKDNFAIAVITGRTIGDIRKRVGIDDIIYAGNHGSEIWDGGNLIISQDSSEINIKLKEILEKLNRGLSHIPGVFIEDKGITASIHFRNVWIKHLGELFSVFWGIIKDYEDIFRITSGKKVFEIRPLNAWNKGDAVNYIMYKFGKAMIPFYIGDDTTDEDAFRAVRGRGISVCVGGSLEADYYLKNQEEIGKFMKFLVEMKSLTAG
ncbi:trehalose-phosphate synthase [bacterium BMS3Abin07]|nr:trehalose-phosphate synthase [bacterium BMS3Abin07]HDO23475.1 bifunctional alpha,alpha-trehalose-phosphate synthase (UDP-forming)/trehalose-phosphatase [Nitrospirota bacterium]